MRVKKLLAELNRISPPTLAEKWDNVGLQVGDPSDEITGVCVVLDMHPETISECLEKGCNTIVSHHPLIFRPMKRFTPGDFVGDIVTSLIRNNVNYIACHTNLDFSLVSHALAEKCEATEISNLMPVEGAKLSKVVVFVPVTHTQKVLNAMYRAGAGEIGRYSECSFRTEGTGTFRGNEDTKPFIGTPGESESTVEDRIEVVVPSQNVGNVVSSARNAHPYEEMAYDVYTTSNLDPRYGFGVIGRYPDGFRAPDLIRTLKKNLNLTVVKVSGYSENRTIKKVAFAGGSAFECFRTAASKGCDAFVVGECKYHDFFQTSSAPMIIEIGHGESEYPVVDVLTRMLKEAFPDTRFFSLTPDYPMELL